jgi:hypothetical protein
MVKYNSVKKCFFLYLATLLVPPKDGRRRNDKMEILNLAILIKVGKNALKNAFISQIWI